MPWMEKKLNNKICVILKKKIMSYLALNTLILENKLNYKICVILKSTSYELFSVYMPWTWRKNK